jgi:outer membrane protein OmpA-like peptidoglycan-associated protein
MRLASTLAVAAALLAVPGAAWAQGVNSGLEVRVNPIAAGGGVLLYPGGEYSRTVQPLLYPGERRGPIQLHMPGPHRRTVARAAPQAAPKPKPKRVARTEPAPVRTPAPAPAPAPSLNESPFGGAANLGNVLASAPPPAPPKTAPAGPSTGTENLTKRSVILFAKDAPDPAKSALGAIKFLASDLNSAMSSPGARVELQAFGGGKGDKGSDARRLSLKRALAIRQVLIDDGVSADRIDVHAMGGVDDTGPADRVDVYVRA